jgi:hypothetical protein
MPSGWTSDGTGLLVYTELPGTGDDIGTVTIGDEESWTPLIQTAANERAPTLSPDGRWLVYTSDETSRPEVYVVRYPSLDGRRQISIAGGIQPSWTKNGQEVVYLSVQSASLQPEAVMSVQIEHREGDPPVIVPGTPERLFAFPYYHAIDVWRSHDVSADGERFLMIEGDSEVSLFVVLNWHTELLERVPID